MKRFAYRMLLALTLVLWGGSIQAEPLPHLENYLSTEIGPCRVSSPARNQGVARELAPVCRESYPRIFAELGRPLEPDAEPVEVRLVSRPDAIRSVVPENEAPPPWAVAVAYPKHNLVVLSLNHSSGSPVVDLGVVLEHELSHLAMRKAIGDAPVPRWFSEGVAIHQSERSSIRRHWLLWTAAQGENLLTLEAIERYPDSAGQVDLAYAEAADFLAFLLQRQGWLGVRVTLREMARGEPFASAFAVGFQDTPSSLEAVWLGGLTRRWQWIPLVTGTGAIWGFIVALFLVAYAVVRRRERQRLAAMEEEEAQVGSVALAEPEAEVLDPRVAVLDKSTPSTKIRVDGDIYTLH